MRAQPAAMRRRKSCLMNSKKKGNLGENPARELGEREFSLTFSLGSR